MTPPELTPWAKVSIMDASHFDPLGAYAAVNTIRLDDLQPHIYRTRDGGKTWTHITTGIPDGAHGQHGPRGSEARGPAVAGTRDAGLRVVRRWRSLAVAAAEHAGDVDPRPGDQGRRPRRRHARPRLLDPRRHHAAARSCSPACSQEDAHLFKPQRRDPLRVEPVHRHAAAARRAAGPEPAGRRDPRLLT